jgi:hypothetical protein
MIFESFELDEPLGRYVQSIFYHKDYMPEHSMERVVPTGNVFLIFELDNIPRYIYDRNLKPIETFTKVWVSGIHQNYLTISEHKHTEMLVVQFNTLGAFPFFKTSIDSFYETVKPAEFFFGAQILALREAFFEVETPSEKLGLMYSWLLGQMDESLAPPKALVEIQAKFHECPFSRHTEVISEYPHTQKHLISQFKKYAGLPPKTIHKIIRFNSLLQIIHQRKEVTWADIVYETGYSDQSHFIKEFQEFSGFTPSKYIKRGYKESIPNFFPIEPEG